MVLNWLVMWYLLFSMVFLLWLAYLFKEQLFGLGVGIWIDLIAKVLTAFIVLGTDQLEHLVSSFKH